MHTAITIYPIVDPLSPDIPEMNPPINDRPKMLQTMCDTSEFIEYYVENLKQDDSIKFQHKKYWNDIIFGAIS